MKKHQHKANQALLQQSVYCLRAAEKLVQQAEMWRDLAITKCKLCDEEVRDAIPLFPRDSVTKPPRKPKPD